MAQKIIPFPSFRAALVLLFVAGRLILLAATVMSITACTSKPIYKNTFIAAGTYLEVTSPYEQAAAIVEAEFRRLEKIFNNYDMSSELSRLNQTCSVAVPVSPELIEVLEICRRLYDATGGAFDVSRGQLYRFWKGGIAEGNLNGLPSQEAIALLQEAGGMNYIDIDSERRTVRIAKAGLEIDLGAIAKGYMVDKAVERLRRHGIDSALINAGGDLYGLGKNGMRPWRVGVRDPEDKTQVIADWDLSDEAAATSGGYEQFFEVDGQFFSHIIDPRSGYPAVSGILSVSVVSKDCATADALATAFYVMGTEAIEDFFTHKPEDLRAMVVTASPSGEQVKLFE